MTARDTITEAIDVAVVADNILNAIRGMSHDELRELRPDIAILFDATRDTANTRGDYIHSLIVGRLRAVEQLHASSEGKWCKHDLLDWPCPTTRAIRGQA